MIRCFVLNVKGKVMATVLAPQVPDFGSLDKAHAEFHLREFQEKRKSLLSELRCLLALPEIIASLRQDTLGHSNN